MFGQATRIAVSMCGAIALVFVIGAPYLIRVLFGAAYLPAVGPSRILIAAAIPLALVMQIEAGLKALNHPEVPSYGEAIGLVITGISLAVLLPRLGTMGAAIASLLGYSSTAAFLALLLKTRTGLSGWTLLHPRATDWEAAVALYRQFRMAVQVPVSEM
jgi:O-antigen/teichoic acid export membrane protein